MTNYVVMRCLCSLKTSDLVLCSKLFLSPFLYFSMELSDKRLLVVGLQCLFLFSVVLPTWNDAILVDPPVTHAWISVPSFVNSNSNTKVTSSQMYSTTAFHSETNLPDCLGKSSVLSVLGPDSHQLSIWKGSVCCLVGVLHQDYIYFFS